jgi:hypothetical protein
MEPRLAGGGDGPPSAGLRRGDSFTCDMVECCALRYVRDGGLCCFVGFKSGPI